MEAGSLSMTSKPIKNGFFFVCFAFDFNNSQKLPSRRISHTVCNLYKNTFSRRRGGKKKNRRKGITFQRESPTAFVCHLK